MGELNSCSLWMKLGVLFMVKAWALHMFSMCTPGWSTVSYLFNKVTSSKPGWLIGVEACEVIGYCCGLTAVVLILCLIFLDEVKSNKVAQICFIVFSIVAGFLMIVGVAIYGGENKKSGSYSVMLCVVAGILSLCSGIFGILDLKGVKGK